MRYLIEEWIPIAALITLMTCANVLQRKGVLQAGSIKENTFGDFLRHVALNPYILLSLLILAMSFTLWLTVLSKAELGYAYPTVVSLSLISVTIASWVVFHDRMSLSRFVGVVVLCVGVFVVSKG